MHFKYAHFITPQVNTNSSNMPPNFLLRTTLNCAIVGYNYAKATRFTILLIPLIPIILIQVSQINHQNIYHKFYLYFQSNEITMIILSTLLVLGSLRYLLTRPKSVYIVNYSCFIPAQHLQINCHQFMEHSNQTGNFDEWALVFQRKVLERSGLGDETQLPGALHLIPPRPTMAAAREEAEVVMFGALDNLLKATNVNPKDIGILIVNCSLFNPNPSLSDMIINKYNLRINIRSFNLSGMGCSASVIAIKLVKDLLQVHSNTYALVVSTENITQNWYFGNNKSMLIPNCLFRVGASSILLSNKSMDKRRANYKLMHVVKTHCGSHDKAFKCVCQELDEKGNVGVSLSKDLMEIASKALRTNITTLGPLVLPISEQLLFFGTLVARKLFTKPEIKPYIPDFKRAFDHFCVHAGGRGVIDELEKNLQLLNEHVEPSRMTLHRFGNTSSSSIWYELAYIESKGRMKKGHKIWQIAFGSGFKCNSAVWECLRNVKSNSEISPWKSCIHKYPVNIS